MAGSSSHSQIWSGDHPGLTLSLNSVVENFFKANNKDKVSAKVGDNRRNSITQGLLAAYKQLIDYILHMRVYDL